jgi:hypothetical protein
MSDHEQPTTVYEDSDMEWYEDDAEPDGGDSLPARPRRRLLTPVSGVLVAVLLIAGGFIGGVQVQKHQGGSSSSAGGGAARSGFASAFAGRAGAGAGGAAAGGAAAGGAAGGAAGAGGGGAGGAGATVGTVANVKGSTLYVTSSDGTTVKVKTNSNSKVTRNASSSAGNVHPGDSVVIQGSAASSGTVTASSITATAKGVSAFGGFGGGGAGGGGAAGGSGTSGGSASQVPQGFAPPAG